MGPWVKKRYAADVPVLACVTPFAAFVGGLATLFVLGLPVTIAAVYALSTVTVWVLDRVQRIAAERRRRRGTPPLQF